MAFRTVLPSLDHWQKLKEFYLHTFADSGFYQRLNIDLETLEGYFLVARADGAFGMVLLVHDGEDGLDEEIVGFAILEKAEAWRNLQRVAYVLLRGVFVKPHLPRSAGRCLHRAVDEWARSRGYNYIQAFVRKEFKHEAAEAQYGYRFEYSVVGRNIDPQERGS